MQSPLRVALVSMIITCPNCQTKYQVTYEAIGSAGRKVQCASCNQSWQQAALAAAAAAVPDLKLVPKAEPESDTLFDSMNEDALDATLEAEEQAVSDEVDRPAYAAGPRSTKKRESADEVRERQKALSRRQTAMVSRMPMARMRRYARVAGVVALSGTLGGAYFGRVPIVERNPDLAGVYEAIGLGVNVVGLDLSNLQSQRSISEGKESLMVSAQIVGLMPNPVSVPPVLVSLLDASGHAIYEWSVAPRIRDLMAGERATFDTSLPLPPGDAVKVRLSFGGGRTPTNVSEPAAEHAPPSAADGHADPTAEYDEAVTHEEAPAGGEHDAPAAAADHGAAEEPSHSPVEAAAPAVHH